MQAGPMKAKDLVFENADGGELISFPESSFESKSWPDIKKYLSSFGDHDHKWIFRGIPDGDYELASSLERIDVEPGERVGCLNAILGEYAGSIHNYMREGKAPDADDLLELITQMHTHGAPANLLEWSHSPYVASYFSIEESAPQHGNKRTRCCIWALNQTLLHKYFSRYMDKFYRNKLANPDGKSYNNPEVFRQIFEMLFDETHGFVLPINPLRKSMKLIAQQGIYTYLGNPRMDFQRNLAGMCGKISDKFADMYDAGNIIKKITFIASDDMTAEIRHDLLMMNISSRTLFPGIEGFTKSLKLNAVKPGNDQYAKKPFYTL